LKHITKTTGRAFDTPNKSTKFISGLDRNDETRGWLKFIALAGLLPVSRIEGLVDECDQLCRILGKSVSTAKSKPRPGGQ